MPLSVSHPEKIEIALPARPESSPRLRHKLCAFLQRLALDTASVSDVLLAAGEAAGNAIEHAYRGDEGTICLRAYVTGRRLVVEVCDEGSWRGQGDPERGRGLGIMRALVDRVSIESSRGGTAVRLEVALHEAAGGAVRTG
jgi:anti-sigma regulatory factor (Ser/Thr protein kinase)